QHFCPKYSRELQARSSNPNSKTSSSSLTCPRWPPSTCWAAAALLLLYRLAAALLSTAGRTRSTPTSAATATPRRDLSSYVAHSRMSVEFCYRSATALRYRYFGLQKRPLCFCGNTYGPGLYGRKSERECKPALQRQPGRVLRRPMRKLHLRDPPGSSASATASRTPETQTTDGCTGQSACETSEAAVVPSPIENLRTTIVLKLS
uniref:WSC domain-containing protein n=1 Tax=Macrostomum lignano TaxID=282301 RepID=A0A1I8F702_9PLAT